MQPGSCIAVAVVHAAVAPIGSLAWELAYVVSVAHKKKKKKKKGNKTIICEVFCAQSWFSTWVYVLLVL